MLKTAQAEAKKIPIHLYLLVLDLAVPYKYLPVHVLIRTKIDT